MTAVNFKGPLVAKTIYSVSGFQHKNELSLMGDRGQLAGSDPTNIVLEQRDGGTIDFSAWATLYVAEVVKHLGTPPVGGVSRVELWEYPEGSENGHFVSVFVPAGTTGNGTAGGSYQPAQQSTISFRTMEGGNAKWQLMETNIGTLAGLDPYPFATSQITAMANFLVSPNSPVVGRDTSFLITGTNWGTTQNSKVFKKRFRF
jgi:hypothetical protein